MFKLRMDFFYFISCRQCVYDSVMIHARCEEEKIVLCFKRISWGESEELLLMLLVVAYYHHYAVRRRRLVGDGSENVRRYNYYNDYIYYEYI